MDQIVKRKNGLGIAGFILALIGLVNVQQGGTDSAMPMAGIPFKVENEAAASSRPNGSIQFLNLGAVIDFKVFSDRYNDETVQYVTFQAEGSTISGDAYLDLTGVTASDESSLELTWGLSDNEYDYVKVNQEVVICNPPDPDKLIKTKISKLYEFDGLKKVEVTEARIGSIVAISGLSEIHIGDTLCSPDKVSPIPFQKISEPTIAIDFCVNDSPLAGQEGKYVTSRHIRDRLYKELNTDVSLRVEETEDTDRFKVSGRGELHLSVLIETMRREGYEFAVSKAEVLY